MNFSAALRAGIGGIVAFVAAVGLSAGRADAACSTTLVAHVGAGERALARSADGRSPSANRELDRNVDLASTEIASCGDPHIERAYYELAAWKAAFRLSAGGFDPHVERVIAARLRDDLATFYRLGGATREPEHYAILKAAARRAYERDGLAFCSPDLTLHDCALASRLGRAPVAVVRRPRRPLCALPDTDATVVRAATPEYPDIARTTAASGTSRIRVTIDPNGNVGSTSVYKSSGSFWLDRAAIAAAKASSFRPARHSCHTIAATYVFDAEFAP